MIAALAIAPVHGLPLLHLITVWCMASVSTAITIYSNLERIFHTSILLMFVMLATRALKTGYWLMLTMARYWVFVPAVTTTSLRRAHRRIMSRQWKTAMCATRRMPSHRHSSATTTFPQAYGLAQMWDPELLTRIADWEAEECRYLAQNKDHGRAGLIVMSPNADLGRDIRWGRTEECYGEDAFLASKMTVAFVKGLQGSDPKYWKTAALLKHFLANSNENERFINSSNINERLFREYYSYTFYKGIVEGGSRAYMAAYNKVNGIPCAVHPMLKDITINEWGQNGIICTDGGAFKLLVDAHEYYPNYKEAAKGCISAGINMFLDDYKGALWKAINENLVSEKEIDQVLRGVIRIMLKLGLLDDDSQNPYKFIGINDTTPPWEKSEAKELAREATVKSIVLLKNEKKLK